MRGLLVRVGVDQSNVGGCWNGPANSKSGEFAYVSIPEQNARRGFEKPYNLVNSALTKFGWTLPDRLRDKNMHLDPDFDHLTYGDQGQRAQQIENKLGRGDLIVFYASFRDTRPNPRLVYALIGLYVIEKIVRASQVPKADWDINAHTRRKGKPSSDDVVVYGQPGKSGRLKRCIPVGSFRCPKNEPHKRPCYRVATDVLTGWGGLTVKDGYLQRSARLPEFVDAARFYAWFRQQRVTLVQRNN
jgi:hypothetical protein